MLAESCIATGTKIVEGQMSFYILYGIYLRLRAQS
jgi:hypothetical protein